MSNHPVQPLETDNQGVIRFKKNAIVEYLLDKGPFDLDQIRRLEFPNEDLVQFVQLVGVSKQLFADFDFVSDEDYEQAENQLQK